METTSYFSGDFSSLSFYVAWITTAFCCFFAFWIFRSSSLLTVFGKSKSKNNKSCVCCCLCGAYANGCAGEKHEGMPVLVEKQTGASMMEQLVPEIMTHALSYLDYPSLCRLSMTNSWMRKAANDDNAWKVLYRKDFTVEQESVTPINGWKAYYAATRAVVNVNAEFYNIIREKSFPAMSHFWLRADYVKCVHASGELFTGYDAVMQSWQVLFSWGQEVAFQVRDVRARVLTDMAWVTMKTYVDMETGPFNVTNVYELHNGQWYMVHHHRSVMLIDVELEHQNVFG